MTRELEQRSMKTSWRKGRIHRFGALKMGWSRGK